MPYGLIDNANGIVNRPSTPWVRSRNATSAYMVLKTATLGFLTVGLVVGDDSGGQSTVGTDRVLGAGSHTEVSQWDWKT